MKNKSRWVCQECGFQSSQSLGRCTDCGSWSSLVEETVSEEPASVRAKAVQRAGDSSAGPMLLDSVESGESGRFSTGIPALDEVLGGGLVPGSVILLAGDPGVGKSTLLLKVAEMISKAYGVLYVSGEESAKQVKLRAERLGLKSEELLVDSEQDVTVIERQLSKSNVQLAIVDSIQSLYLPELSSAPGSVSQVRESAGILIATAKSKGIATVLVGHVTKDGSIAGPRVLEHMVDVVLQFEGESTGQLRILRAVKNRYGSTQEIAVFSMTEAGLVVVDNPSTLFLGDRLKRLGLKQAPSGTAVIAGGEGTKTLLLEVQALVGSSPYPSPSRVSNGWDLNRLLQILAVLEKKVGLSLSRFDVYINIVGGFDFSDPAGDLGVAIAVATSFLDRSIDPGIVSIGEIGLTGEVRPVVALERRLKEAARMGFRCAIVPQSNLPLSGKLPKDIENIEVIGVEFLVEALSKIMPGQQIGGNKKNQMQSPESVHLDSSRVPDSLIKLDL